MFQDVSRMAAASNRVSGPSPLHGLGLSTLTLRQYNQRLKESKLTTELARLYRTPTSTTTTTTRGPNRTTTARVSGGKSSTTQSSRAKSGAEGEDEVTTTGRALFHRYLHDID